MQSKWISQALKIHRGTLEKAQEKSLEKINAIELKKKLLLQQQEENGEEDGDDDSGSDDDENENDSEDGNSNGNGNGGEGKNSNEKKKYTGGFSVEQCMIAVRLKAKEREEAANNRVPVQDKTDGSGGAFF